MDRVLMVGTRKGLWVGRSDESRRDWMWSGPHFDMAEIYSCLVETRGGRTRLWAAPASSWLGPQIHFSDDLGETWNESTGVHFPEDVDATVERVWQLMPGIEDEVMYAGTEPGAVFRSADGGQSWELERALWDHPHREQWGAGFGGQAFHTVLPHPTDPDKVLAAISSGGCYRTDDGGASWAPYNSGIRAEFLPEGGQYPEFGQCTHKIARHPDHPERLFLQNHGGVYRSRDAGGTWDALGSGLPDNYYVGVMRDAMDADDHDTMGLYFGDRSGSVWVSPDEGETWTSAIDHLPDVMVVRAAAVRR